MLLDECKTVILYIRKTFYGYMFDLHNLLFYFMFSVPVKHTGKEYF